MEISLELSIETFVICDDLIYEKYFPRAPNEELIIYRFEYWNWKMDIKKKMNLCEWMIYEK